MSSSVAVVNAFIEQGLNALADYDVGAEIVTDKEGKMTRIIMLQGEEPLQFNLSADFVRLSYYEHNNDAEKLEGKGAYMYTVFGNKANVVPFADINTRKIDDVAVKKVRKICKAMCEGPENKKNYLICAYFVVFHIYRPYIAISLINSLYELIKGHDKKFEEVFSPKDYAHVFGDLLKIDRILPKNGTKSGVHVNAKFYQTILGSIMNLYQKKKKLGGDEPPTLHIGESIAYRDYRSRVPKPGENDSSKVAQIYIDSSSKGPKARLRAEGIDYKKNAEISRILSKKVWGLPCLFDDYMQWNGKNNNYSASRGAVHVKAGFAMEISLMPQVSARFIITEAHVLMPIKPAFYSSTTRQRVAVNEDDDDMGFDNHIEKDAEESDAEVTDEETSDAESDAEV